MTRFPHFVRTIEFGVVLSDECYETSCDSIRCNIDMMGFVTSVYCGNGHGLTGDRLSPLSVDNRIRT